MDKHNALSEYRIDYLLNGQPGVLILSEFSEPSLEQIKLQLLLQLVDNPQVVEDAPWETPGGRSSLDTRLAEVGISDIRVSVPPAEGDVQGLQR